MPKRKANSSRIPPELSDDHGPIDELIANSMPKMQPLATRLDEIVREIIPDAKYAVKWSTAYYGLPDVGWIIEIGTYHVSVNIGFFGGADFDPPPPLGEAGKSRYIKLRSLEEVEAPEIRSWIEQSKTVDGWS